MKIFYSDNAKLYTFLVYKSEIEFRMSDKTQKISSVWFEIFT